MFLYVYVLSSPLVIWWWILFFSNIFSWNDLCFFLLSDFSVFEVVVFFKYDIFGCVFGVFLFCEFLPNAFFRFGWCNEGLVLTLFRFNRLVSFCGKLSMILTSMNLYVRH